MLYALEVARKPSVGDARRGFEARPPAVYRVERGALTCRVGGGAVAEDAAPFFCYRFLGGLDTVVLLRCVDRAEGIVLVYLIEYTIEENIFQALMIANSRF